MFRPDPIDASACSNTYENCCPNSNFFESAEVALAWGREHGIPGPALSLPEATADAIEHWPRLADNIDLAGPSETVRRLADAIRGRRRYRRTGEARRCGTLSVAGRQ